MEQSFTLSRFLRHSGEVLAAADADDVVLRRRDASDLVLTTHDRLEPLREGLDLLARAALGSIDQHHTLERALFLGVAWTTALTPAERSALLGEVAVAASTAAQLGATEPLAGALDRWRRTARLRASARPVSAHATRPVAIPDDVDDPAIQKAHGEVELPLRVRWSHPRRTYNMGDPRQLRRVYEQVLREGNDDDVRRFIDVDTLIANWDQLVLPPRVRRAWAEWLGKRRGLDLAC